MLVLKRKDYIAPWKNIRNKMYREEVRERHWWPSDPGWWGYHAHWEWWPEPSLLKRSFGKKKNGNMTQEEGEWLRALNVMCPQMAKSKLIKNSLYVFTIPSKIFSIFSRLALYSKAVTLRLGEMGQNWTGRARGTSSKTVGLKTNKDPWRFCCSW